MCKSHGHLYDCATVNQRSIENHGQNQGQNRAEGLLGLSVTGCLLQVPLHESAEAFAQFFSFPKAVHFSYHRDCR